MFLKSLDIQGFKSFPDRMHIEFHEGLTGIVGPNGSGKSNVSDAIRWVLGEQSSRSLRGSKMEDVIFAGAQGRRPSGFAEVSLTLDNSAHTLHTEFEEVTVTRRYYRSGESEYYLNRKAVRLKDIHELFMDTGLGRDGYSVIGQGRIDEILSVRSEDRREIFDEAAGISKYRYRREEAERKLKAAEENLERAADLVKELEDRLGPLEKQAQKERKYNILREEQRGLEISLWLRDLDAASAGLEKVTAALETAARDLGDCRTRIEGLYAERDRLTGRMRELEREREDCRALLSRQESDAASAASAAELHRATLKRNLEDIERLRREAGDYDARLALLDELIGEKDADAARQEEVRNALLLRLEEAQAEASATEEQRRALIEEDDALGAREEALRAEENALNARLTAARTTQSELRSRLHTLESEAGASEAALRAAEEEAEKAESSVKTAEEALTGMDNVIAGYSRKLEGRAAREEAAQEKHTALRIRLGDMQNRIRMLRELEREYEGYNKAVRAVMTREMRGIRGPVSSLLHVDDRYVTAIETALGAALQNIVVEREEDARDCIEMLKRRGEGRATFLPLSAVHGTELDARQFLKYRGVLGIASRLVEYDPEYTQIFANLLGRTLIVDTLDNAIAVARATAHRQRLVTLDGQIMASGGAMTGGAAVRSTGILSRANELARLVREESSCEDEVRQAADALTEARRAGEELRYSLENVRTERQQKQEALGRLQAEASRARQLADSLAAAGQDRSAVLDTVNGRLAEAEAEERSLAAGTAELDQKRRALRREQDALDGRREAQDARRQETALKAESIRGEMNAALTRAEAAREAADRLRMQRAEAEEDKKRRSMSAEETEKENETLREAIAETETHLAEARAAAEQSRIRAGELQDRREDVEGRRTRAEKMLTEENRLVADLEREHARLDSKRENLQGEQDKLSSALWDEYGLTGSAAREVAVPLEDPVAAKKRADELRRQIRALGSVYTGAIEEYEQVKERYDFLTTQRDDAENAKKQLGGIIAELTKQMRIRFAEQFQILNEAFGKTFQEVFGGGQGKLELDDPDNVLDCGIEIRVQLPGKSLKVISLLSGGEKAFVAIALYFAIIKVRPAPFCIMDEIDAALDDVNVQRFASYMRRYLNDTQFIVITHRRHTMEAADMLYGVAMPTQGVSRMLELDVAQAVKKLGLDKKQ